MRLPAQFPVLESSRLILRGFCLPDAPPVQELAGAREIASTTLLVPHPYLDGMAEHWIGGQLQLFQAGQLINWAMILKESDQLCGAIGLTLDRSADRAELGYWVGLPFWGKGYCTEAAQMVSRWAFDTLALNRLCACHFARNPASGRVLRKIGLQHEGTLRQHIHKWDRFEDVELYGAVRGDF